MVYPKFLWLLWVIFYLIILFEAFFKGMGDREEHLLQSFLVVFETKWTTFIVFCCVKFKSLQDAMPQRANTVYIKPTTLNVLM